MNLILPKIGAVILSCGIAMAVTTPFSMGVTGNAQVSDGPRQQRQQPPVQVHLRATLKASTNTLATVMIRFDPSGQTLATGTGEEPINLWDVKTGRLTTTLHNLHDQAPKEFSPDGRVLATTGNGHVYLVNASDGALIVQPNAEREHRKDAYDLIKFSPSGDVLLMYGVENYAVLWDVESLHSVGVIGDYKKPCFMHAAFSPDGRMIGTACSADTTAKVWSAITGKLMLSLPHRFGVREVLFTSDGRTIITASLDDAIRLWDATTGQLQATLRGHRSTIYEMALSPGGRLLATASRDGTAKVWDLSSRTLKLTMGVNDGDMLNVVFNPDGRTLATLSESREHAARLWNAETGELIATLQGHEKKISNLYFSKDGRILVSESKDTVRLWNGMSGDPLRSIPGARWPSALSPDGHTLATAGEKGSVFLWDIR